MGLAFGIDGREFHGDPWFGDDHGHDDFYDITDAEDEKQIREREIVEDRVSRGMWLQAKGKEIPVVEMTDIHLLNTERMLMRKCEGDSPYYPMIEDEIERRGL